MCFTLLDGSLLVDDCMCGRPAFSYSLRGTFRLVFREENPLFKTYDVKDVKFHAGGGDSEYDVTGEGTYQIGGEVALVQRMDLSVTIGDLPVVRFLSGEGHSERIPPMIEMKVSEPLDPMPLQFYQMHIIAAPVREMWFSTIASFTSGIGKPSGTGGDLLSQLGSVVKRNCELTGGLGIMPMVPNLGLDAVDIAPGGEVLFSCELPEFSETLGPLQHGDLLSDRGRIVRTNQQLTSAFIPKPVAPDVGLDAVQVKDSGEILFSIEQELFSEALGVLIRPGDLLSERGVIVTTNKELLANFDPVVGDDVGLDAIHVWPSGEIWFSTEVGFESKNLGTINDGDLLSTGDALNNKGSIVFRSLEVLQAFGPMEDLANYGLDALFLVTESGSPEVTKKEVLISTDQASSDVRIAWFTNARVSQVERAEEPGGPYVSVGPISPDSAYVDLGAALGRIKGFYRLRLW